MPAQTPTGQANNKHPLRRKAPMLFGGAFLLVFTAGVIWLVVSFIGKSGKPEAPKVQRISLIQPPPPKPPEEKPPEPKKEEPKEEVKVDQPQPKAPPPPDQPPPPAGGIAAGPANGMQTDLAVGGGLGNGGGAQGAREAWYGREISHYLEGSLRHSQRLKDKQYTVTLNIWFNTSGNVTKVQVVQGSGNAGTDSTIHDELLAAPPMRDALPDDLPQPVKVRLESRA